MSVIYLLCFHPPIKVHLKDIAEMLLKVILNMHNHNFKKTAKQENCTRVGEHA
jgi:hypothetical protein